MCVCVFVCLGYIWGLEQAYTPVIPGHIGNWGPKPQSTLTKAFIGIQRAPKCILIQKSQTPHKSHK